MAAWLAGHLPQITVAFLSRAETPRLDAKR